MATDPIPEIWRPHILRAIRDSVQIGEAAQRDMEHLDRTGHPLSADNMGTCRTCQRNARTHREAVRMCYRCGRTAGSNARYLGRVGWHHFPSCPEETS